MNPSPHFSPGILASLSTSRCKELRGLEDDTGAAHTASGRPQGAQPTTTSLSSAVAEGC